MARTPAAPPRERAERAQDVPPASDLSITMTGALPPWRGVAPYTRRLLEAMEGQSGVDIEFIDFSALYPPFLYPGGDPLDRNARTPSFAHVQVRRLLAWYNPVSWVAAGLTLRGQVVHAQHWAPALAPVYAVVLSVARLRGRRVVLTLHNVEPHEGGRVQRALYRSVFRLADRFIVHSARNAEALVRAYPRAGGRTSVVPLGVGRTARAHRPERSEARRSLRLPVEGPVLLAFGNIRPYKGLDVLLRALRLLADSGVEATLAVAGQPWGSFEPYRRLIDELSLGDRVRAWPEFVPEETIERFFAAADIAVFPYTHFDAQSAAAALAASFGTPAVVTDVGGLAELVDEPRAVVPPGDASALAEALRTVLADGALRARMAETAHRKAAELDWGAIAARTAGLYRELLQA